MIVIILILPKRYIVLQRKLDTSYYFWNIWYQSNHCHTYEILKHKMMSCYYFLLKVQIYAMK